MNTDTEHKKKRVNSILKYIFNVYSAYFIAVCALAGIFSIKELPICYKHGLSLALIIVTIYHLTLVFSEWKNINIKINKCFAMLSSIGAQLICYIMLTLSLVFFFAAYFDNVMDRIYVSRIYNDQNCPGIENHLTEEIKKMLTCTDIPNKYLSSLSAKSVCDSLTKNDILKLTVAGTTQTTKEKGAQITFNFITNIEFETGKQREKRFESSNCTLIITTTGKRFLELGQDILNNKKSNRKEILFKKALVDSAVYNGPVDGLFKATKKNTGKLKKYSPREEWKKS